MAGKAISLWIAGCIHIIQWFKIRPKIKTVFCPESTWWHHWSNGLSEEPTKVASYFKLSKKAKYQLFELTSKAPQTQNCRNDPYKL